MSKGTILVHKSGSLFRTRGAMRANTKGENGETEGLVRRLCSAYPDVDVVYWGLTQGDLPCPVIRPHIDGIKETSTGDEQRAGFALDVADLQHYQPILAFIETAGYTPTMSLIDNPRGANVLQANVRYVAPKLNVIQSFKLPRIVVNNDPRTYPKDQEMSYGWDYCRPAALLDQYNGPSKTQVVGGQRYVRRAVYARNESWAYHIRGDNTNEFPIVCVAHAHIEDGTGNGSRTAWDALFSSMEFYVYGRGWPTGQRFLGELAADQVNSVLRQCICCPVVAHTPDFYTGKPFVLEAQGCIPLLFGSGAHSHTWDKQGIYLPLDDPWRIKTRDSLPRLVDRLATDDGVRAEQRERWREICQPDWTVLDRLVEDLGRLEPRSSAWTERYGGYIVQ